MEQVEDGWRCGQWGLLDEVDKGALVFMFGLYFWAWLGGWFSWVGTLGCVLVHFALQLLSLVSVQFGLMEHYLLPIEFECLLNIFHL